MTHVAIIEDDIPLRNELAHLLELQGYETSCISDFPHAVDEVIASMPDCVVLDLTLPDADGHSICRGIKAASSIPVIMLTSSVNEFDEVMALGLGANDYIIKPYRPAVLLARIQSVLRNANPDDLVLSHKGVSLNERRATVSFEERTVELTRNEIRILGLLIRNPGKVVTREELMYELWESSEFIDDNTLTVNINRLRKSLEKLGIESDFVKTHRGIGYSV